MPSNYRFSEAKNLNHIKVVTGENMIWGHCKLHADKKILETSKINGEKK